MLLLAAAEDKPFADRAWDQAQQAEHPIRDLEGLCRSNSVAISKRNGVKELDRKRSEA
jgi:predicted trehalose synthase